ncbi:hypothetical protein Glove_212g242 [Diversispora epigaea]|uniref:Uncharacterized protein n=1 Tax=Diversispora epigaea TaxID=1348612 RepID=A0A397IRE0_9GLOM|nr:hypothetical protein Glove_212g242 [Diversispora epigaea]
MYKKKLEYWTLITLIWVYGKSICENKAEETHITSIDRVCTFLTWYLPNWSWKHCWDNQSQQWSRRSQFVVVLKNLMMAIHLRTSDLNEIISATLYGITKDPGTHEYYNIMNMALEII